MAIALIIGYIPPAIIGWIMVGIPIAFMQQMVLRKYATLSHWDWASILGWSIGVVLGKAAEGWQAGWWDLDWAVLGLSVGIGQTVILKKQFHQGGWWIFVSSTALILAGSLGGATDLLEDWFMAKDLLSVNENFTEAIGTVMAGSAGGAVLGAITGLGLIWLFHSISRQT
jgi:hypothetical protein